MPFPTSELAAVWNAARRLRPDAPLQAWQETHGVALCGPFEAIAGTAFRSDADKWTRWRGFRDPPEAQCFAVVQRGADWHRLCLFRDDPAELPSMIVAIRGHAGHHTATCVPEGSGKLEILGTSLAVELGRIIDDGKSTETAKLLAEFSAKAKDKVQTTKMRQHRIVAKTASGAGIVVPYDKKTELGYREPMIERPRLMKLLTQLNRDGRLPPKQTDELDEQLRFNDISNDECDFGLGLQLGLDMLSQIDPGRGLDSPVPMHTMRVLHLAYLMLGRQLFGHILQCSLGRLSSSAAASAASAASPANI